MHRIPLDPRMAYSLGRSNRCSIPLEPRSVSRRHGLLFRHDGSWWLADCGSTRGLRVEAGPTRFAPLTPERWIGIGPLVCWLIPSTVNVGELGSQANGQTGGGGVATDPLAGFDVEDSVDLSGEHAALNETPGDHLLLEPVDPARRAIEPPRLIHLEGVDHVTVGSGPGCAIRLASGGGVRPLHMVVYREPRTWVAIAADGTLLAEGQRFLRKRLEAATAIEFGGYSARLVSLERADPTHQGDAARLAGPAVRSPGETADSEDRGGPTTQRPPAASDLYSSSGGSIFLQPSRAERFKAASNADLVRGAGEASRPSEGCGRAASGPQPTRIRPTHGESPLL